MSPWPAVADTLETGDDIVWGQTKRTLIRALTALRQTPAAPPPSRVVPAICSPALIACLSCGTLHSALCGNIKRWQKGAAGAGNNDNALHSIALGHKWGEPAIIASWFTKRTTGRIRNASGIKISKRCATRTVQCTDHVKWSSSEVGAAVEAGDVVGNVVVR